MGFDYLVIIDYQVRPAAAPYTRTDVATSPMWRAPAPCALNTRANGDLSACVPYRDCNVRGR